MASNTEATTTNMGLIAAIVGVATIGGFMFGYDSGAINGTQEGLKTTFGLSDGALGQVVSSLLLGCATGAFLAGRLADVWGRRAVMMAAAILFIISAIGSGSASGAPVFVIFRFLAGAAVGAASVLSPAYISEVTPASVRGRLGSVQQIMIITGLTGAFVANYFLAQWAGSSVQMFHGYAAWRWMFWVQAVPAILFLITLLIIPESPRFLVAKGRDGDAQTVLGRLFGTNAAVAKLSEIKASLQNDHKPSFSDLLNASGGIRPIVWVGIGLAVFQQLVGINVVFYYGAVLWQAVGFSEHDAFQVNIISGTVSILACLVAIGVIDKLGRKPMLLIGSIGMAVTLAILTFCFSQGALVDGKLHLPGGLGTVALFAANIYVIFFNFSWGPVMWVMLGEMFPNQMRGSALAIAGAAQWVANYLISSTFPPAAAKFGLASTYGFYTLCAAISAVFVTRMVNETKGRELEAMEG